MAGDLKGAIIGAGYFAQFHGEAWQRMPGARIAAVVDPDRERASEFARKWGIPNVYERAEEMIDRERPDFVDIITRPDTHLALTERAARNGIQVICQKPMAPSVAESNRMVERCEEAGVRLVIHENWRWQPWYREIKRMIEAGRLGPVFHISFLMRNGDGRGPEPYMVQPYFRTMPKLLLFETAVHFLDTFRYLCGEIELLFCTTQRLNPVIVGEDYALITLVFRNGARGSIDANRISGPMPVEVAFGEMRVEGEKAAVRMSPDGSLWLTEYGKSEVPHAFEKPMNGYKGDSVFATQKHFIECLQSGREAESEGRVYLRTVEAVEACYRSADTGAAESLA
jgi:D-apiose dehydrogenase